MSRFIYESVDLVVHGKLMAGVMLDLYKVLLSGITVSNHIYDSVSDHVYDPVNNINLTESADEHLS